MKQLIQNLNSKQGVELVDFPTPLIEKGKVLIQTKRTLVSKGTESMLVKFGNASYIQKAKQKPDRVKQVIDKIKAEGLIHTVNMVRNKLDQSIALGYCNCGVVIDSRVNGINVGDRVISNGPHAEVVRVSGNLVAKIPENVNDDEAVFTVIGSIGLQGMRLCNPTFGETIVVVGLGLVGLITIQLLKANGVNVIGIDLDKKKCLVADSYGVKSINGSNNDYVEKVIDLTKGVGADGVIITAATKSNEIISQAAKMSRKRGRIILVGVIGLNINRDDFYEKELTFQVSCSYGPGRYDSNYELNGIDYPLPYVRWTEKRNFETILQAISNGNLKLSNLITEKVALKDYKKIYDNIDSNDSIASLIDYEEKFDINIKNTTIKIRSDLPAPKKIVIGIIGAGNFTKMVVLPFLSKTNSNLKYIASSEGMNSTLLAKKFNIVSSSTDYKEILNDPETNIVFITTRHDNHSKLVVESLQAGKNVFVEKPLSINREELDKIVNCYNSTENISLMVGYNRRFSPHVQSVKKSLGNDSAPVNIIANMNAGKIPDNHWANDELIGGGRIIGEACHLIDLCIFFSNSKIHSVCMNNIIEGENDGINNGTIMLRFINGSNASINYFINGAKSYSKERIEIYSKSRTWIIDNYRKTTGYGVKGFRDIKTKIDKGHKNQFIDYINSINEGGKPLIPVDELINSARASFAAILSLKEKSWIKVDP